MFSSTSWVVQTAVAVLALALLIPNVYADDAAGYCSGLNTADTNRNSSIYQSVGLCHDFCISKYAFAVVQGKGCWCSNYAPGTITTGCTDTCPGYPQELCGGSGVFGYIALALPPSGTKGAAAPSSSSVAPTTSAVPVTVTATPGAITIISTLTADPATTSSTTLQSTTVAAVTTSTTPTTPATISIPASTSIDDPATSSTWTPTPVISVETVTGMVRTVTSTPTAPPNTASLNTVSASKKGSGGLGTGGAVGLTIGLVAIIAIVGACVWYYMRKRREEKQEAFANLSRSNSVQGALGSSGGVGQAPSRTMSEHSRYVLNTNGHQVVETWEGAGQSPLVPVDPRLDPFAPLYQRGMNPSRESVNTLRDDQDYSRRVQQSRPVLRINNPDSE